ncbi:MAG: Stk1 family PASTA domain-containing Ser/Thr kinase [Acidimicrobiia bacterium]
MDSQQVLSDRYALVSHLARGGMADVYVAEDRRLGRQVAVKILHSEYARSEAFIERFRREAQAAANLTHPGVVAVHDWGEDDGTYFMVMELVQGRNLREVVRSEGALLPRRVAEIGVDVASALSAAHAQGLVHRDIKPANILLMPDGKVKVADFGIARAFDDQEQLTRTGAVIGTATYFSPEQAQGFTADSRSDIYSLGVVLYELLTGQPPFHGESPVAVAYQHVREEPELPSDLNPNIPRGLEAVVLAAMAKHPDDRYQTAEDMAADLRRVLAGQVPLAAPENEAPTRVMAAVGAAGAFNGVDDPFDGRTTYVEPAYQEPGRVDRTTITIGILAAAALVGLGLILLVRLLGPSEGTMVSIPNFRGQTVEAATERLEGLGLVVDQQIVADDDIEAGRVTGTDPPAGEEVEKGSTVTLLVSGSPGTAEVPDVVNRLRADAEALIEAAGLEVGTVVFEASPVVDEDVVIAQSPPPGEIVDEGTPVDLTVSAGVDALTVPDVVNQAEANALFALQQAGFELAQIIIERRPHAEILEGFVIETEPPAGELLPSGGTLLLILSEGAVPSVVPNVIGMTENAAIDRLEEFGFVVSIGPSLVLEWDDPNEGLVAEQDPSPGETHEFGSSVTIRLGEASTEVTVPDVDGMTQNAARNAIEDEGLVFQRGDDVVVPQGSTDVNRAVSQSPGPGTTQQVGTTVVVSFGFEGAEVPNMFTDGGGGCPGAVTRQQANQRLTDAGLVLDAQTASDDEYSFTFGNHECEGRAVQQTPPPGEVVAAGSSVTVVFDPVFAPLDYEIYEMRANGPPPTNANNQFPVFTFEQSDDFGGFCNDPNAAYQGFVRMIDPEPEDPIPFNSNQYLITYWVADPVFGGGNPCPPYDGPPP